MTQHSHHQHTASSETADLHDDHDAHAGHSAAMFRSKFWLTLLLTIPTIIWSETIQQWFGYTALQFTGSSYMAAIFGIAVYIYGGSPFLQGGYHELRDRLPGMMTLI